MTGGQHPEGALTVKDLARALLAGGSRGSSASPSYRISCAGTKMSNSLMSHDTEKQGEQLISGLRMQTPQL
jgi:hypothetical protein